MIIYYIAWRKRISLEEYTVEIEEFTDRDDMLERAYILKRAEKEILATWAAPQQEK